MNDDISMLDYIDARFADHDKQHAADHRALDAASLATDHRLEGMNEFRASLSEAQATYVTRDTLDAKMDSIKSQLESISATAQRSAILSGTAAGVLGIIAGFAFSEFI